MNKKENQSKKYIAGLSITALGIAFGDIATSPLYTFRESFHLSHGIAASQANILGILSLILWSLILVVSIKYMIFILQADLEGEGGVLVLTELITPKRDRSKRRNILILIGLFGAALLYGDSTITPAITTLSAIEGLTVATNFFEPYIVPIVVVILVLLFLFQRHGTASIGKVFGPTMALWFVVIGAIGIYQIVQNPAVFKAINPAYGVSFFVRNGYSGFLVLGSVFLAVTGAEVLYADIGHFGTKPIRLAWFGLAFPCLLLCYFGQGALLLRNPEAIHHPFFLSAPDWALYPLVAIATAAAIIASQAVITGTYSLTRQGIQFGYFPRMRVDQTSGKEEGQIYMPGVNWLLMFVCIGLVIAFQSSNNLAAAYGMAVTSTMVFTTIMFTVVMHKRWKWSLLVVIPLAAALLIMDLSFFGANLHKIPEGGWFPLVIAAVIFTIMTTWKHGRKILSKQMKNSELPLETFLDDVGKYSDTDEGEIKRVNGTAVYMYSNPKGTPPALLHNIKHNFVIHKDVVLLSVQTNRERPYIPKTEQLEVEALGKGFYRIIIHSGFAQGVNVPRSLKEVKQEGLELNLQKTSFFIGSERVLATDKKSGMAKWREKLFGVMVRNEQKATAFFGLPANRVVELGAQVEL